MRPLRALTTAAAISALTIGGFVATGGSQTGTQEELPAAAALPVDSDPTAEKATSSQDVSAQPVLTPAHAQLLVRKARRARIRAQIAREEAEMMADLDRQMAEYERQDRIRSRPGPDRPGAWKSQGSKAKWNPCRRVNYKVNLTHAPAGVLTNVHRAFAMAHAAGGLEFHYAGRTTKVPFGTDGASEPGTIIVAWASPLRVPELKGRVAVGGPITFDSTYITSAGVTVSSNGNREVPLGFHGFGQGAVLLHEIGHALGLAHIEDHAQIMNPDFGDWTRAKYSKGDSAGLRAHGAGRHRCG